MRECDLIEESIGRWLDGELSAAESERVRGHVKNCANCAATHRRLEKLDRALSDALVATAPNIHFATFWRDLEQRLEVRTPWHQEIWERLQSWGSAPRIAWGIPAIIAALLAVFTFATYFPSSHPRNNLATVESIDSYGRNVALLREDESKTTVIWLYQNKEGDDEAADETPPPGPAF